MADLRRELRDDLARLVRHLRGVDDAQALDLLERTMRTFAADQLREAAGVLEERADRLEARMDLDIGP